jgi:hypothetical protein
MSPTTEKMLAFDLTSKNKLQHYEIDWLNPLVILSESFKYLKKNEILPNTHESQLSFLMNKFEPGEIKLSISNMIGEIGHTATKLCYPLPAQKDKIISRFIQLVLSVMIYSVRETVMKVLISSSFNSIWEYNDHISNFISSIFLKLSSYSPKR